MKISHAIKDITEVIPEYPNLKQIEKDWLLRQYVSTYKSGAHSISQDVFSNYTKITSQSLSERLNEYPEIKLSDTLFLKKLAEEDKDSLDAVLKAYDNNEDFIYETYEENFMDTVPTKINQNINNMKNTPEALKQFDIDIILQEAYSQGIIYSLDSLAKKYIVNYARNMLAN